MDNRVQGILNTLFRTEHLHLQCSVPLFEKDVKTGKVTNQATFCNIYHVDSGTYASINPTMSLKLKYIDKLNPYTKSKGYDRSTVVYINQRTINYLIAGMKQFWELYQRNDLFIYDDMGVVTDINMTNKDHIIISMDYNQFIQLTPTIFEPTPRGKNSNCNPIPGIAVYINVTDHVAPLTVEEYRDLIVCLEKIDFNILPLILLQNFLLMKQNNLIPDHMIDAKEAVVRQLKNVGLSAFQPSEQKEFVGEQPLYKPPTSLNDL